MQMWFFTLALLIVAGYLLYDAMRDRMILEKAHELGTAHRRNTDTPGNTPHRYINTTDSQHADSTSAGVSAGQRSTASPEQPGTSLPHPPASGVSEGSTRTRDSILELWDSAKSKRQINKAAVGQRQTPEGTAGAVHEVKSGTKRSIDSVGTLLRGAKSQMQAESEQKKNSEPTGVGMGTGFAKFKKEVNETLHDGTVRAKDGFNKRVRESGSVATAVVGDQTTRLTEGTRTTIGSGTRKFKDSVAESLRDADSQRIKARESAAESGERTTVKETLVSGSKRVKDSLSETWAHKNTLAVNPGSSSEGGSNKLADAKETLSTGVTRFKNSLDETLSHAKSAGLTSARSEDGIAPMPTEKTGTTAASSATSRSGTVSDGSPDNDANELKKGSTGKAVSAGSGQYTWPSAPASEKVEQSKPVPVHSDSKSSRSSATQAPVSNVSESNKVKEKRKFFEQPQGKKDDLTKVKGIGPVIEKHLNEMGIYHFHQLASINQEDIDYINEELDFPGRIERDNWIEQASELANKQSTATT